MKFLKLFPILVCLLLGFSCESTVEALTGQITVTMAFTGDSNIVFYSIQELRTEKDFEKKSLEEKRVLQEYQWDELLKMPMLDAAKIPDSVVRTIDRKTKMNIKVNTGNLNGEVILRIYQSSAEVRSVKIFPNSALGYQIIRIN